MKKRFGSSLVFVVFSILVLSVSFASAFSVNDFFDDVFGEITGEAVSDVQGISVESATHEDGDQPPENAVDGNSNSYYSACSSPGFQYNNGEITFDLEEVKNITEIEMDFHRQGEASDDYPTDGPSSYRVLVSENKNDWKEIYSVTDYEEDGKVEGVSENTIGLEGEQARYIRISYSKINDGTGWCFGMDEINVEIFESEDSGTEESPYVCNKGQRIGDVNGDGNIDNIDSSIVTGIAEENIVYPNNACCGDVNKDGEIDNVDASDIGAHYIGGSEIPEEYCGVSNETVTCSDSDGGLNYGVKGYLNTNISPQTNFEDYCISNTTLIERHCLSNNSNNFTVEYDCQNGCSNGACIGEGANVTRSITYYDERNGDDYHTFFFASKDNDSQVFSLDIEDMNADGRNETMLSNEMTGDSWFMAEGDDFNHRDLGFIFEEIGMNASDKWAKISPLRNTELSFSGCIFEECVIFPGSKVLTRGLNEDIEIYVGSLEEDTAFMNIDGSRVALNESGSYTSDKGITVTLGDIDLNDPSHVVIEVQDDSSKKFRFYGYHDFFFINSGNSSLFLQGKIDDDSSGRGQLSVQNYAGLILCSGLSEGDSCDIRDISLSVNDIFISNSNETSSRDYAVLESEDDISLSGCVDTLCVVGEGESLSSNTVGKEIRSSMEFVSQDSVSLSINGERSGSLTEGDSYTTENGLKVNINRINYLRGDAPSTVVFRTSLASVDGECQNGCLVDENSCIPYGIRSDGRYCDIDGQMKDQKGKLSDGTWASCDNNYECESNICSDGQCVEWTDAIEQTQDIRNLGVRILCRLASLFEERGYEQCISDFS